MRVCSELLWVLVAGRKLRLRGASRHDYTYLLIIDLLLAVCPRVCATSLDIIAGACLIAEVFVSFLDGKENLAALIP